MILDTKVTLFSSCKDVIPAAYPPLGKVFDSIRNPTARIAHIIAECRAESDKKIRNKIKSKLPAVCFGAELNHRKADDQPGQVKNESGIMCLDFDGLENPLDIKSVLKRDGHIVSVFISPSGNGVKAIVPVLSPIGEVFRKVASWYGSAYNLVLDEARKDQTGLCFASHDPDLFLVNDPDSAEPFKADSESQNRPIFKYVDGDVVSDFITTQSATDPLMMINPDCDYSQWIEIGQALHCQFSGSLDGLALWDQWSRHGQKYAGEKDVEKHYKSFKSAGITFRTILKYAADAGWTRPGRPKKTVQPSRPEQTANELHELIDAQISGDYSVAPWPWKCLTEQSRSLMPGSVTILCGAPGSAKSWFILMCLRYWVANNISSSVLMLEENKGWHLNRLLAHMVGEIKILKPEWVKQNGELVHSWEVMNRAEIQSVGSHLSCDGNVTLEACCTWVEKCCDDGVRIIVIDPITLADPGNQKTWDADRRFMARAKVAIEKSGASLILVSHPRKSMKPLGPPQMDDLAGGAAYTRAAASVLWMNGTSDPVEISFIDESDCYREGIAHKMIRVLKSRNGIGQNAILAYTFNDLSIKELGTVVKAKDGKQP